MTNELGMSSISRNSEDTCATLLEQLYYMHSAEYSEILNYNSFLHTHTHTHIYTCTRIIISNDNKLVVLIILGAFAAHNHCRTWSHWICGKYEAQIAPATTDASSNSGTQFIEETVSSQNKVHVGIDTIEDNLDTAGKFLRETRCTTGATKRERNSRRHRALRYRWRGAAVNKKRDALLI